MQELPEEQKNDTTLYPMTEALIEDIMKNPSKKIRKKILRDKNLVEKNTDYTTFKAITNIIAKQYKEAVQLVSETKQLLAEEPDEAISSVAESLENDLDKVKDKVTYLSSAFDGVKQPGTRNIQQRLKVLHLAEDAQQLSHDFTNSILPAAAELGILIVGHIEKIEEELKNE